MTYIFETFKTEKILFLRIFFKFIDVATNGRPMSQIAKCCLHNFFRGIKVLKVVVIVVALENNLCLILLLFQNLLLLINNTNFPLFVLAFILAALFLYNIFNFTL